MDGDLSGLAEYEDVVSEDILADVRHEVRKQFRFAVVAVGVVCLIVGGLIGTFGVRGRLSPGIGVLTPPPYWEAVRGPDEGNVAVAALVTVTPSLLNVYVAGSVVRPGVVTVSAGSLLADALEAAGGATVDADLEEVNLAAPLTDNQHIVIPALAAEVVADTPSAVVEGLVNINTATQAELETLPHIGPALAQRIIDYREENGPFVAKVDVQNVSGIGETRYADIEALITVD